MVYQYIQAAGVVPNPTLATAMFYGIQADTRGLSRGASSLDQRVYFELLPLLDHQKLIQVEQAGLPREYFRALSKGLQAAKLYDQVVVCYLGEMHRPDFMAEMADLLIRLNSIQAALCIGYHSGTMYLSLRTLSDEQDAGILIQKVVVKPGRAGGHGSMAGGQVPLAGVDANSIAQQIEDRFVKSIRGTGDAESLLKIE
jgi:nanoRNase/pAp phosphatase (c-di-AMP/oligoRNAs hydrolase)